jgi:hypothetical protein
MAEQLAAQMAEFEAKMQQETSAMVVSECQKIIPFCLMAVQQSVDRCESIQWLKREVEALILVKGRNGKKK